MKNLICFIVVLSVITANAIAQTEGCTIGVISGTASSDGRPVLFKNRDSQELQQRLGYFSDPSWNYSYLGVYSLSSTNVPTMGINSAGLAVGNSAVAQDTGIYERDYENGPMAGFIMSNFEDAEQVKGFLAYQNIFRLSGCFPFIDAKGNAVMLEVLKPRDTSEPRWIWTYNADDSIRNLHGLLGIVPRANEFHEIEYGLDNISIEGRYKTNRLNLMGLRDLNMLNPRTIIQGNNGSGGYEVIRYGPYRPLESISKNVSQSAIIAHGVKPGEDPALSILWVVLGQSDFCIAVPAWVRMGDNIHPSLKFGLMWDRSRSLYDKYSYAGTIQASIFPAETHIFDMVYNEIMPHWREIGLPAVADMVRVHYQIADDAYSLLYCLDNTRYTNKAPVIGPVEANPENGLVVNFSVSAGDTDGEIVSWSWNFGDGSSSTKESTGHTYNEEGTYLVSCTVTDNEDVSITSWRYVTIHATSVADIAINDDAVKIYPNPTNGSFTVDLNGVNHTPYDLEIVNLIGKVITRKNNLLERNCNLDITGCPKGIYLLRITQGSDIFTGKIAVF